MKTQVIQVSLVALTALCLWQGCRKTDMSAAVTPFTLEVPQGFPAYSPVFRDNPLTREAFELGRRLFYDGRLANDGVTS